MIATDQDAQDAMMTLYQRGMSDREISRTTGIHHTSIGEWRRKLSLPPHYQPRVAPSKLRMSLYELGLSDREIARREGCHSVTIQKWRVRNSLPANGGDVGKIHTAAQRAARMLLYSFRYTDARIAKEQGVSRRRITTWRQRLGLAAHWAHARSNHAGRPSERVMLDRIKRALPGYLSPADRDDAAADLFLAVLSGDIKIEEIEARAKKFGNKVISDYASKWGPRSLDEDLSDDGDGFRMIDLVRDDRSSSWLEEMGATAW